MKTQDEFDRWWQDFASRFPGKAEWLSQSGASTLEKWREILSNTELTYALDANRELHEGREDLPHNWDLIPSTVKRIARRLEFNAQEISWGETECTTCHNTGIVVREDERGRSYGYACTCSKGDIYAQVEYGNKSVPRRRAKGRLLRWEKEDKT